jgi:L-fuconolactonase
MKDLVDAHHHVWKPSRGDYVWLTPARGPVVYRDLMLEDMRPYNEWAEVETSVLVSAAPTVAETRFLLRVANESNGFVRGVVGWVDLAARDAIPTLTHFSRERLYKSVRPMLQDIADPEWLLREEVQPALKALPRLGVRFDALVRPVHLPALLAILDWHPDLSVVVDHGAKPDIANKMWQPWADQMRAVAQSPRVRCKLSGLTTVAGPDWTIDTLRPYVDHLIECFGPERLMWGSDWPVVELSGGYKRWRAASIAMLQGLSEEERAGVLGGNARRFYGLD